MHFIPYPAALADPENNRIRISDEISVEWKDGVGPLAQVKMPNAVGLDPVQIVTAPKKGWVRLHASLYDDPRSVLGARVLIKARSPDARIKPFLVFSNTATGARREIAQGEINWIALPEDEWVEVKGAYACPQVPDKQRIDLVIDLSPESEFDLMEICCERFGGRVRAAGHSPQSVIAIAPFAPFAVEDLSDSLSHDAIYATDLTLADGVVRGGILTNCDTLTHIDDETGVQRPLIAGGAHVFGDVEVLQTAFQATIAESAQTERRPVYFLPHSDAHAPFWSSVGAQAGPLPAPRRSRFPRDRQDHYILLWAPIAIAGLTVQLEQVTEILDKLKFPFKISYHMEPRIDHPLREHWIHPHEIDSPKAVIYFERFVAFDRGFEGAYKVFYMNLDWLSPEQVPLPAIHANMVICPTPYLLEEMQETFHNSKVVHLPWPSKIPPAPRPQTADADTRLKILYVGNDYDAVSRKHPAQVIEAIERITRTDVCFDLKFRNPLPYGVRRRLRNNPRVRKLVDWHTSHEVVGEMYREADINLIPNACEGNGLSILEAWATGAVPAVLNGHPMIDVTSPDNSFRIECVQEGMQQQAPYYVTTADDIAAFINGLDAATVQAKKDTVRAKVPELVARDAALIEIINSIAMMSGLRTRGLRMRIEDAHKPASRAKGAPARVKSLMLSEEGQSKFRRTPELIDVLMTTSRRPWCLRDSLDRLLQAMRLSPFQHRLVVSVDNIDPGTMAEIQARSFEIDQVLWTTRQQGLPYTWNSGMDMIRNTINRTERRPDYICYIQDDCLIHDPAKYFETMVGLAHATMPGYLGYISGYHTDVHPGFAQFEWNKNRVIASDSFDGKNFMAPPEIFSSVGPLTWHFKDGMRRGNPGPKRGSHFDLWQWKESPNSLSTQKRISLILPDLCGHTAERAEDSTWNNDTTDANTAERIKQKRVYKTR